MNTTSSESERTPLVAAGGAAAVAVLCLLETDLVFPPGGLHDHRISAGHAAQSVEPLTVTLRLHDRCRCQQ